MAPQTPCHRPSGNDRRGLTLTEVVIALAIFTLVCGGALAALIQGRRMAEAALYESSALVAAQGYLEQIKSFPDYNTLLQATLPLQRNSDDGTSLVTEPLTVGQWSDPSKTSIDVYNTPTNTNDDLFFRVRPLIDTASVGGVNCCIITVEYEWRSRELNTPRMKTGSLRVVRAADYNPSVN